MNRQDRIQTIGARLGNRNHYTVVPGVYAVGAPDATSPVVVTANYKLTFDAVRKELTGQNLWLLVIDTRGINVWCAAGKNLFSTEEIVRRVSVTNLSALVSHRTLILPQLGAPGVTARDVKKATGFSVVFGPVRAQDLPEFIANGMQADIAMRTATFPLAERAVLIPVELVLLFRTLILSLAVMFVLSGIGESFFSVTAAVDRMVPVLWASLFGVLSGQVVTPLLLPWLPYRAFSAKGALVGSVGAIVSALVVGGTADWLEHLALAVWCITVSSFLAMNFTGSTPYTSPSGVEYEMRKAVPLQAAAAGCIAVVWLLAAFV